MRHLLSRSAPVLVAVLVAVGGNPDRAARAADEHPDLQIELVGLPLSNSQREVHVRVTNVSKWWTDKFTVTVETVSPTAGNRLEKHFDDLDPGKLVEIEYTLAAPCNGHVVKAEVSVAKNYAGVPESNTDNNKTD